MIMGISIYESSSFNISNSVCLSFLLNNFLGKCLIWCGISFHSLDNVVVAVVVVCLFTAVIAIVSADGCF